MTHSFPHRRSSDLPPMETSDMQYDVIVVGSGASGLTAAIRAAKAGLSVLVLEKADHFGGTTAVSGGGIWIPGSPQEVAAGVEDSPAERQSVVGGKSVAVSVDLGGRRIIKKKK